jgi:hypothetical protein
MADRTSARGRGKIKAVICVKRPERGDDGKKASLFLAALPYVLPFRHDNRLEELFIMSSGVMRKEA